MPLRIFLIITLLIFMSSEIRAKELSYTTFTSLSHTLGGIFRHDTNALQFGYTGKLLQRLNIYRTWMIDETKKVYPFIPAVWSKRPTLDTTHLYTPYIQKYSLSCEIAAVRMVMESFGKRRSEESIIKKIPHYPGELSWWIWWDPEVEFVGYLTGTQGWQTGYGVYEKPLADYLRTEWYTVETQNLSTYGIGMTPHKHLLSLLDSLETDSRVILWGDWCTEEWSDDGMIPSGWRWILRYFPVAARNECARSSDKRAFSWTTPTGKIVNGLSWEHTFVLLGYIGSDTWITHVIVWDTYTGRHIFSYDEWMRKWELMEYRSLRVERKH